MHDETIRQLDEAVLEVFAMMLNRVCRPGASCAAALSPGSGAAQPAGIDALVTFSGSIRGVCKVYLGTKAAETLMEELVGSVEVNLTPGEAAMLRADAAGELCNMIAGSWKGRQAESDAECTLSPPLITVDTTGTADVDARSAFRHSIVRVYRFGENCLRLELSLDDVPGSTGADEPLAQILMTE